jgi:phospholipid transport system substrate-binding protein
VKSFIAATILLASVGLAHAQGDDAAAPIKGLDDALVTAMKTGKAPFPDRYNALAPAVDRAFNLPKILQTAVGLRWQAIPPADQTKLLAVFRAYTICSYVSNFNDDSGTRIEVLKDSRAIGADRVVETQIVPKNGDPTPMNYVMRQSGNEWQAIDVLEQGTISQVAVQRSDFRNLVGNGADKLIASLQQKVDTMSGGTIKP